MKQRVLVQGAENFVGSRVSAALAASDWAEPLPIETRDTVALRRGLSSANAIARCVVGSAETIEAGLADLYQGLKDAAPMPRVVHLSSMTVYGSAVGAVREDADLLADLGPYSRAQREAERIARGYGNSVILRPGGEYGPGCVHWSLHISRLLLAGRLGHLGPNGNGCCNLLFIDDLVAAIIQALTLPGIGGMVFNLGDSKPPTWNEYLGEFARALRAAPVRSITPLRLQFETRALAPVLKGAELAFKTARIRAPFVPPAITSSMLALWRHAIRLDVGHAEEVLGMRWTNRRQGLEQAAAWCRDSLHVRA
jgi:nucleoside-diphosphate-sugar epimerase